VSSLLTAAKLCQLLGRHQKGKLNDVVAESAVYLTSDRQGCLWAAGQYRYRVQRFLPGFHQDLEILVGRGEVHKKEPAPQPIELARTDPARNPTDPGSRLSPSLREAVLPLRRARSRLY
jgi:hypothetical protein